MSVAKKITKKIIEGGLEVVKDSAKQMAGAVSPANILEQALGTGTGVRQEGREVTRYLQDLHPDISPQELEKKQNDLSREDSKKMEEARKLLKTALPAHLRPAPKPPELRPYEKTLRGEEEKKAMAVEAQKKSQQPLVSPAGKQPRGSLFVRKSKGMAAPILSGSEGLKKDRKIG